MWHGKGQGGYKKDKSGLYHYAAGPGVWVGDAAAHALKLRKGRPAWFWFNDTPAPIHDGDTPHTLGDRWTAVRDSYSAGASSLLTTLAGLCGREVR